MIPLFLNELNRRHRAWHQKQREKNKKSLPPQPIKKYGGIKAIPKEAFKAEFINQPIPKKENPSIKSRFLNFVKKVISRVTVLFLLLPLTALASPIVLDGVPAYNQGNTPWCTFVSEASVFGYYDTHGYPNLFSLTAPALLSTSEVWPEVLQMVQLAINNQNNPAYNFASAIMGFAALKGYTFTATDVPTSLNTTIQQIDKGLPLLLITNGNDPIPFHSEVVFGYEVRPDGTYVAYYNNYSESEVALWKKFDSSKIYDLITITPLDVDCPEPVPVPESNTIWLLGIGLIGLLAFADKPIKPKRVCAWHTKNFGHPLIMEEGSEPGTHGMCGECKAIMEREVKENEPQEEMRSALGKTRLLGAIFLIIALLLIVGLTFMVVRKAHCQDTPQKEEAIPTKIYDENYKLKYQIDHGKVYDADGKLKGYIDAEKFYNQDFKYKGDNPQPGRRGK